MQRSPISAPDTPGTTRCESCGSQVPQEHTGRSRGDSSPRDWSHLGRRVLAEAWRRLTDERHPRRSSKAAPVVPAPHAREAGA